jgi:hypothetical protein
MLPRGGGLQVTRLHRLRRLYALSIRFLLTYSPNALSAPLIYNHNHASPRVGMFGRSMALGIALASLATLVTAVLIVPSSTGVETHRQLGMPPCGLLLTTGLPCMTCGMTTSFAHFAHGQVLASLWVQPGGTLLAFLAACAVWAGGYIGFTGLPGPALLNRLPWGRMMFALLGVLLAAWTWKMFTHVNGMGGWNG